MSDSSDRIFTVGRRWGKCVLGFAILETILLIFAVTATRFNGDAWTVWCIILFPLLAAPTVAAILVSPGSRFRHWISAFGLLLYGSLALSLALQEGGADIFLAMAIFVFSVALLQAGWIRWTSKPGWVVRPSTRRSRNGVSLSWLIAATGLVAVGFGAVRILKNPEDTIHFFAFFAPSVIAAVYANVVSTVSRKWSRRAFIFIPAFLLVIFYRLANAGLLPSPASLLFGSPDHFAAKTWYLAPSVALLLVASVHRSFAAMNSQPNSNDQAIPPSFEEPSV